MIWEEYVEADQMWWRNIWTTPLPFSWWQTRGWKSPTAVLQGKITGRVQFLNEASSGMKAHNHWTRSTCQQSKLKRNSSLVSWTFYFYLRLFFPASSTHACSHPDAYFKFPFPPFSFHCENKRIMFTVFSLLFCLPARRKLSFSHAFLNDFDC